MARQRCKPVRSQCAREVLEWSILAGLSRGPMSRTKAQFVRLYHIRGSVPSDKSCETGHLASPDFRYCRIHARFGFGGSVLQYLQEELPMSIRIESAVPLLAVFDVPRAIAFYRDALGFEVANTSKPFTEIGR